MEIDSDKTQSEPILLERVVRSGPRERWHDDHVSTSERTIFLVAQRRNPDEIRSRPRAQHQRVLDTELQGKVLLEPADAGADRQLAAIDDAVQRLNFLFAPGAACEFIEHQNVCL